MPEDAAILAIDLEIFHNRRRRRSSLGMLIPIEFEKMHNERSDVA